LRAFFVLAYKLLRIHTIPTYSMTYRSVPLIRPHFVHYIQPKVEGGLIFEYAISLEYKPSPKFTRALRTLPKFMFT